jgi:hypothetical protein
MSRKCRSRDTPAARRLSTQCPKTRFRGNVLAVPITRTARAHTRTVTIEPSDRPLLPVACTLGPVDGAQRLEEWRRLSATTGLGQELAGGKLTLRFRDLPGVREELDRLVAAERECCGFLGWEVTPSEGELHVQITGNPDELRTLAFAG